MHKSNPFLQKFWDFGTTSYCNHVGAQQSTLLKASQSRPAQSYHDSSLFTKVLFSESTGGENSVIHNGAYLQVELPFLALPLKQRRMLGGKEIEIALLQPQNFNFLFYLGWSGCFTQSEHNITKVVQS